MAGHSKWANIKHRKAAQDAKRGKIFTRLIREITVSARMGGGEPADNPRLRAAVDKALGANMTKDTIEKAIRRGVGQDDGANVSEITYEGYAPGGVAVLVETMTDNVNRTVSEVRHGFSKHGGNLGTTGSVSYLFSKRGELLFEPGLDEDALMEAALEAGAEDVEIADDSSIMVVTSPDQSFGQIADALAAAGFTAADAEVTMHPANRIDLDADTAAKVARLVEHLEDLEDVQAVHHNAVYPED